MWTAQIKLLFFSHLWGRSLSSHPYLASDAAGDFSRRQHHLVRRKPPPFSMRRPKTSKSHLGYHGGLSERDEIKLLNQWIESQIPESGSNPLSVEWSSAGAPVGRLPRGAGFSPYAGCRRFEELPISARTREGLLPKYKKMSTIQRASLPHSLCGRDVLGAAKTGSGKTLAFIIPVLEKLYRASWGPEDGVGCIIISPTRELAAQLFEEIKNVGKKHSFSAGLLIGGCKDVDEQKDRVNGLNILVCTPGRLLQHMDETPNFDCSQLQILVLDEADRILDTGFKKVLDAILSQLPRKRQTLLFSATQTKSVQDLARLSLTDPEYLSVHAESTTATPGQLEQTAMIVPIEQKLDVLWTFIKTHLNSKMLVFLSSCKQVKFVFEAFKKLRPGIPLSCLHGGMNQSTRLGVCSYFHKEKSVLFATDVASRGLDIPSVDWVVQVDCPEDVATYVHRVGRTARFKSKGRAILFLAPSESEMLRKLETQRIPIRIAKANPNRLQKVSDSLAALLVKYPNLQELAKTAFLRYLKSIYVQKDKEVFDVHKLPIEFFSASMGIPMTPKVCFLRKKSGQKSLVKSTPQEKKIGINAAENREPNIKEQEDDILWAKEEKPLENDHSEVAIMVGRSSKNKKKLKINAHKPFGTRVVFDKEGNTLPPLAALANQNSVESTLQLDKVGERYKKLKEDMKQRDTEDKILLKKRLREKRTKEKTKMKQEMLEEEDGEDVDKASESYGDNKSGVKRSKIRFESDSEDEKNADAISDSISLAEQEALALKLLSSMHS